MNLFILASSCLLDTHDDYLFYDFYGKRDVASASR